MINRDLFYFLYEISPQLDRHILRFMSRPELKHLIKDLTPETEAWRFVQEGYAMEYYDHPERGKQVTWFWEKGDVIIPTSHCSTIVTLDDAAVGVLKYGDLIRTLKQFEEARTTYRAAREKHAKEIAERINDIKHLTPLENYTKLLEQKPWVFEHADKEDIASYLGVSVSTLDSFSSMNV